MIRQKRDFDRLILIKIEFILAKANLEIQQLDVSYVKKSLYVSKLVSFSKRNDL